MNVSRHIFAIKIFIEHQLCARYSFIFNARSHLIHETTLEERGISPFH